MWQAQISHPGLHAFRVVKGETQEIVNLKAAAQLQAWDEKWQRIQARENQRREKEQLAYARYQKKELAEQQTREAEQHLQSLETVLRDGIEIDPEIDWSTLENHEPFPEEKPPEPVPLTVPPEPLKWNFQPQLGFFDHIWPGRKEKRREESKRNFKAAQDQWHRQKTEGEAKNRAATQAWKEQVTAWEARKSQYAQNQSENNALLAKKHADYLAGVSSAVEEYCELVLQKSEYPDCFPDSFTVDFAPDSKLLAVEYLLPAIEDLPTLKQVKYIASKDELQEAHVTDAWLRRTYDLVLYQVALRTTWELFKGDAANFVEQVVFNGWVKSVDKATVNEINPCILSVQASKSEFLSINLAQVDAKACFKKLKGVSASKLSELTPIRPVLQLNKTDVRFISPYAVADSLDSGSNLAAMDWEDFEHLIRELFEKEFKQSGGEVKITRASRDHGVDAVVFDPDPIRGGKIVIQAKRYTNTVSVSAVRDLYGTILNEGANKGILVTTADYGSDAYEFANGKPITLLSGSELLYLLGKHGHKARIDLAEARRLLLEEQRKQQTASAGGAS